MINENMSGEMMKKINFHSAIIFTSDPTIYQTANS